MREIKMLELKEIKMEHQLLCDIDWEMTPEEAVTLYLEWGNNWSHGKNFVRSKNDVTRYFVINSWDDPPKVYLIERNSEKASDLAVIDIPKTLRESFLKSVAHRKGVYAITGEIKRWLQKELLGESENSIQA
jgi:hypothetical protein